MRKVIYGVLRDNINDIDINYLNKIYPEMIALVKGDEEVRNKCAMI